MSERSPFAGLEVLAPGEPVSTDGYAFTGRDRRVIDRILQVGAVTHVHDGHTACPPPTEAPGLATAPEGGTIPADTTIHACITYVDAQGGETTPSGGEAITTRAGIETPQEPPELETLDYAEGVLLASNYDYALTVTDGHGGETALSPALSVVVEPGHPKAAVILTHLKTIREAVGGTKWRLWRRQNGGVWYLLQEGEGEGYIDDGSNAGDCTVQPPSSTSAHGTSTLTVTLPGAPPAAAVSINLYLSQEPSFASPSFVATYPVAEAGKAVVLTSLELQEGEPPIVNLSLPGASKIDPDKDMLEWPWKRPVAKASALPTEGNVDGDARFTLDDHALHVWNAELKEWPVVTGGGGGGEGLRIENEAGVIEPPEPRLQFVGPVAVADDEPNKRTVVTIASGTIISYKGEWVEGTEYKVGDVVLYKGSSYLSLNTNVGLKPDTNPTHWGVLAVAGAPGPEGGKGGEAVGLVWKGPWSNVTKYKPNDGVSRNGSSYICVVENEGNDPATDGEVHWNLLAAEGATGEGGGGGIGVKWKGVYSGATTYAENDLVEYEGSTYISLEAANKANKPDTHPLSWGLVAKGGAKGKEGAVGPKGSAGLRYRGPWAEGTTYQQFDVVKRGGVFYISVKAGTQIGHEPPNALYWEVFSGGGPVESKVWALKEVENGLLAGWKVRIDEFSEAGQKIIGLDVELGVGEAHITVRKNGEAIFRLTNVPTGTYVDMTSLVEAGEGGKYFPVNLLDGDKIDIDVTSATEPNSDFAVTLHIRHITWGD